MLFAVTLVASVIGIAVEQSQNPNAVGFVTKMISSVFASMFQAAVSAFAWVTLGFALFERFGNEKQKRWSVKDLPQMPKPERISRRGSIVSMVFSVVLNVAWVVVILRYADQIAWYQTGIRPGAAVPCRYPTLDGADHHRACGVLALLVCLGKVAYGSWNYPLAAVSTFYNVANAIYVSYFLNYSHVFNEAFFVQNGGLDEDIHAAGGAGLFHRLPGDHDSGRHRGDLRFDQGILPGIPKLEIS